MIADRISTKTKAVSISEPAQTSDWYSVDDVIDAWENGKRFHNAKVMKQFEKVLKNAQGLCEGFVYKLETESKVKCKEIHLKIETLTDFTAIYVIPEKSFLSFDKFSEISTLSAKYLTENSGGNLEFSFLFMPSNKRIDNVALQADGFTWTFKKTH